ncbi:hypothetical protein GPOL_c47680 [Gordonia polyisoprenivorans VH2]|uniref:HNH nuclease domain-containing protein n=2 Tax=Gordonia polyisoprenivorans TaxID=84595 RepID=H6N0A9_GORPV|nr:hypothetical protein GPOL_c47680 [Gordonia polyisoprenivorans VH2]
MSTPTSASTRGRSLDSACSAWPAPAGAYTIYTGAIGDDGYGRFWLGRHRNSGGPAVVRAQRFAYAAAHGLIPAGVVAMHECDNPICVAGTEADNLAHMGGKHRGGGSGLGRGTSGLDRLARHARAVALRDAVAYGGVSGRVREPLGVSMPGQRALFDWDEVDGVEMESVCNEGC